MDTNLLMQLKKILKHFPKYWANGELQRHLVIDDLHKYDIKLISELLKNSKIRDLYTVQIGNTRIFKQEEFIDMLRYKKYWTNSYTKYSNEIGLSSEGKYIKYNSDVVLDFPYKDCVLEGGMTKEDVGRNEIYYNEIIARDEIDTLLEPKVFTNIKKYDKDGEHEILQITDNDNLIIKGNNLLTLSSLKKRYLNSVKLAFWDVPYNTGSDSFKYNDKFSRSTWLTFMKNRVEKVMPLLKENGVLLIQCSFHQYAYIKVLLDEIIGNYIMTFNILVRHPDRILTGDKDYNDVIEYILVYSKSRNYKMPKQVEKKKIDEYIYQVKLLSNGKQMNFANKKGRYYLPNEYKFIKVEPKKENFKKITVRGSIKEKNSSGRFYVKFLQPLEKSFPAQTLFKISNIGDDIYEYRYFYLPPEGNKNGGYLQGMPMSSKVTTKPYSNFIDFVQSYNVVNEEGEVEFRNGKKPEDLISYMINIFTKPKDICLDAFSGSGTTLAVALKMNRKFIGIEQMDYIGNITIPRLKKVINGEQSGISKDTNWQGGGSFIYVELMKLNQYFIDKIFASNSSEELINILKEMKEKAYLDFKVNIEKIIEQPIEIEDNGIRVSFIDLPLNKQKEILINILDKNQLYVNYYDMEDEDYHISDKDKIFNYNFYKVKGEKDG